MLKELVKEKRKPALDHLPADALDLWKVSTPEGDNEGLKNFVLEDYKILGSTWEIGSVFEGDPPKRHAHIISRGKRDLFRFLTTHIGVPTSRVLPLFICRGANSRRR